MVSSGVGTFTKQAACPSSKLLLDYCLTRLAPELNKLVEWHLEACDFCWAEVRLLVNNTVGKQRKDESRPPAMPVNLRVLAEAVLFTHRPRQQKLKRQSKR